MGIAFTPFMLMIVFQVEVTDFQFFDVACCLTLVNEWAIVACDQNAWRMTITVDYGIFIWSWRAPMRNKTAKKPIQEIAISEFKAKCLSLLEEVSKTKTPLRVTRRGKALADVIPASPEAEERSWIGSMSETVDIVGDIVSPVIEIESIEALKN
jgi:prevent-host-death family protein